MNKKLLCLTKLKLAKLNAGTICKIGNQGELCSVYLWL